MKEKAKRSLREEAIINVYERYIKDKNDNENKYSAYQFVQKLLWMSDQKFQEEFNVNDEGGAGNLVKLVKENEVKTIDELRLKAAVAKHVEWSTIDLDFSDDFRLEKVRDELIVTMLENVENRIQWIYGSNFFIIVRRISDSRILKRLITKNNKKVIERLIQQCNDN